TQQEYPTEFYEPYCAGPAVVFTPLVAAELANAAESTTYFWIDDVYVTGMLVRKIRLKQSRMNGHYGRGPYKAALWLNQKNKVYWWFWILSDLDIITMNRLQSKEVWYLREKCRFPEIP